MRHSTRLWLKQAAAAAAITLLFASIGVKQRKVVPYGGCGQRALIYLLTLSGQSRAKILHVQATLGYEPETNLAQLQNAGLGAGINITYHRKPTLDRFDAPCLVWLVEGHFVVVKSVNGMRVDIYDPSLIVHQKTISMNTLSYGYGGSFIKVENNLEPR